MATTTTLQHIANAARPFLKQQPVDFANQQPALEAGNMLLQTILGPPFKWPWNRNTFSFPLKPGVPDATVLVPDFGFLETQWITDPANRVYQLNGETALAMPTNTPQSRPTRLALARDDNRGNLVFRLDKTPDAAYIVSGDYQRKPPILRSVASTLSPFPDHLRQVFMWGYLALLGQLVNDVRVDWWEKKFAGHLLALQDGLSDQERNIFQSMWRGNVDSFQRGQGAVQSGTLGRQA